MKKKLLEKVRRVSVSSWIILAIILLGIFLRTYHFHDWLHFGSDQSRDAMVIQKVLNGENNWPSLGPEAANTGFYLGPIYYYFQIISAKIFGTYPDVFAYPDLLFSVASIPLLYYLLKKYFSIPISLSLSGIYAVSFYSIQYSRFAWNTNSIPFFTMLFVLSLIEILLGREKTSWWWVIVLGMATGIGMQLHTILLLLFPLILFCAFIFSMKKSWKIWTRWVIIIAVALILNSGQILHEMNTDYANVRTFIRTSLEKSQSNKKRFGNNLETTSLCHAQANFVMVSSLGDRDKCSYETVLGKNTSKKIKKEVGQFGYDLYLFEIALSIAFSIAGYALLIRNFYQEKDQHKKYFLGVILAYVSISFLLLISVLSDAPLRYFIHTVFVPLIFIGFILDFIKTKVARKYFYSIFFLVILFFVASNLYFICLEAGKLSRKERGDSGYAVLGEIEPMVDFIIASTPDKQAYLFGRNSYFTTYASPIIYVAAQRNFTLIRGKKMEDVSPGEKAFYVWKDSDPAVKYELNSRPIEKAEIIGNLGIYQLKN